MVAQVIEFMNGKYQYSHAKHNILTYVKQPEIFYDDWVEYGGILVVQYSPDTHPSQAYYVLHSFTVSPHNGRITQEDISKYNKLATVVE